MEDFFASFPPPGWVAASLGRFLFARFQNGDQTVAGSTDAVVTMGVIIVLIVVIPIVVARRRWMR
ncbi:MAG: hypothetical protein HFACDABA_02162 [Anaerolineales bacterium]|nr:hypothetical protein [Anaerolineales bacterium]